MMDQALAFAAMGDMRNRAACIHAYLSIPQEDLAAFSHMLQEIAYGEKWVQQGAAEGAYNPDKYRALEDDE